MNKLKKYWSKGFTMIEIMVVVVIVAILAAVAVPIYIDYVESARASEAKSVIGSITNGAKMYRQTYGEWPGVEQPKDSGYLNYNCRRGLLLPALVKWKAEKGKWSNSMPKPVNTQVTEPKNANKLDEY